jgi:hypothetical protein
VTDDDCALAREEVNTAKPATKLAPSRTLKPRAEMRETLITKLPNLDRG